VCLRVGKSFAHHPNLSIYFSLQVSLDPSDKGKALLLTTSTELAIAPKSRLQTSNTPKNALPPPTQNQTAQSSSVPPPHPQSKSNVQVLRALPFRFFPSLSFVASSDESLAYVSRFTFSELTGRSAPKFSEQESSRFKSQAHKTEIRRLLPPSDPNGPSPTPGPPNPAVPKVLNAQTKEDDKPKDTRKALLIPSSQIPDKHIVFANSVDGAEDFDLVWCVVHYYFMCLIPRPRLQCYS
jgi:peroxin-1